MTAILPSFTSLPLKTVLAMDLRGYQITQKMDGRTAVKSIGGFEIIGELMRLPPQCQREI